MDLAALNASLVDGRFKGIPGDAAPFAVEEIAGHGWNVLREDMPLPLAVLKESALEHNSCWMRSFLALSSADIAPHGKTTMAPQLFRRQLDDGAWGITLANVSQVQVARWYGVRRILLANQLVGRQAIGYVADELSRDPAFEFFCLVDSVHGVQLLVEELTERRLGRPLDVLLEGGFRGGRTGCRSLPAALEVAEAVKRAEPLLRLRGVEGFEGIVSGRTPELRDRAVEDFLDFLMQLAVECESAGFFGAGELIFTAGGSAFYDLVVRGFERARIERDFRVVIRSGCYLSHDSGMYRREFAHLLERSPEARELGEGLRPALEVWGYVQSRPEPGLCIVNAGKRDVSYDYEPPIPERWFRPGEGGTPRPLGEGYGVSQLNDQHTYLTVPVDAVLRVGDMVSLGISHPCTTFDCWQSIPVVDDDYNVVDMIRTYF